MKKNKWLMQLLLCIVVYLSAECSEHTFFSKVIIWGHPLYTHTHSYIHDAFYRAFEHLGYELYWVTDMDEIKDIDLHHALFITEGQVDYNIPHRNDCYYILHNCAIDNYRELFNNNRCIILQVYTDDCLCHPVEKLDDYIYCYVQEKIIFMPWATDLLPHEIEDIKQHRLYAKKEAVVNWVGTVGDGRFGNQSEIEEFKKACTECGIAFNHIYNISAHDGIELIKKSYMAPALQGSYQCEKGYIPCRIFKNISYGQWGITNNKAVYDLFEGKVIYNPDTYQLFYDAQKYINSAPIDDLYVLMELVKNKHTYINRIETLLTCMEKVLNIQGRE